jgi:hypothetical protein
MMRCPRCHVAVLIEVGPPEGERNGAMRCLGCGAEIRRDPVERVTERVLSKIRVRR